jgi:hypothetical protein
MRSRIRDLTQQLREARAAAEAERASRDQALAQARAERDAYWGGELGMVQAGLTDPASRAAVTAHWGSLPKGTRGETAHGWWESQVMAHRAVAEGKEGAKAPELPQVLRGLLPQVSPPPKGGGSQGRPPPHQGHLPPGGGADEYEAVRGKGLSALLQKVAQH